MFVSLQTFIHVCSFSIEELLGRTILDKIYLFSSTVLVIFDNTKDLRYHAHIKMQTKLLEKKYEKETTPTRFRILKVFKIKLVDGVSRFSL